MRHRILGLGAALSLTLMAPAEGRAAPEAVVRTLPVPVPQVSGLAYGDGALWLTGAMGPGMISLVRMDPVSGSPEFFYLGSSTPQALGFDGGLVYAMDNAASPSCGLASANQITVFDPSLPGPVGTLPSPLSPGTSGLALQNGSLFVAGSYDADPCDAALPTPALVELDAGTGAVLHAVSTAALGDGPDGLASDGVDLLYAAWGPAEAFPIGFELAVHRMDASGTAGEKVVLFESPVASLADARAAFQVGGVAWGQDELFVLNLSTLTVQVFALPAAPPLPPPPPPPPPPPTADAMRIDIKPGDDANEINMKSSGKVPVAVLASSEFNPGMLDLLSVRFAGAPVCTKPNGGFHAGWEDVNGDALEDLVLHFSVPNLECWAGDTEAELVAETLDGVPHAATDAIHLLNAEYAFEPGRPWDTYPDAGAAGASGGFGITSVVAPGPSGSGRLTFVLEGDGRATLTIFSVTGRRIGEHDLGAYGAGVHQVDLSGARGLGSGVYFVRLQEGSRTATARFAVIAR